MRASLASLIAACAIIGSTLPAYATQVNLPAGTQIQVHVVHSLSSGSAMAGQQFAFETTAPVVINNRIVIAKGALGSGRVVNVSKAQGKSAGKMTLAFNSVHAVDGGMVMLTEDSRLKGNSEKGKASTATIAATIALGPIGLFAHNMVKGKDVTVSPGQTFPAWVKSNTSVKV